MPQICALKVIDGELWARIGKPSEFRSGVALWTPAEQATQRAEAYEAAIDAIRDLRAGGTG